MSRENLETLLGRIGGEIGATNLQLDADGYCLVRIDDRFDLSIEMDEDSQSVILTSRCGTLPAAGREALLLQLLDANYYWVGSGGATLSTNSRTGAVCLQVREPTSQLEQTRLQQLLHAFLANTEFWLARLESLAAAPTEAVEPASAPAGNLVPV